MTRRSEQPQEVSHYNADASFETSSPIWQPLAAERAASSQSRLNGPSDLVSRGVIPKIDISDGATDTIGVNSGWRAARQQARAAHESASGGTSHTIRYGDTMWDIARASMKNQGHDPSQREIANEVARLAKKNGVNPNNIPIGTEINLTPDGAPRVSRPQQAETRQVVDKPAAVDKPASIDRPATVERLATMDKPASDSKPPGEITLAMPVTSKAKDTSVWRAAHLTLAAKAEAGAPDVAFFGDSITAGLSLNPSFRSAFGGRSENFGIGGDRTENLLYRLQHGEADFNGRKPRTAVVAIGTNDIGSASESRIVAGILANAKEAMAQMPGTEIVVLGILPRGQRADDPLRRTVNSINAKVRDELAGVANVKFVDIGPALLDERGTMRADIFQPDNVHLKFGPGYNAMLRALQPHIRR